MNRHTPSFFVSLVVHVFFAVLLFVTYKYVVKVGDNASKKKICIKLNCIAEKSKIINPQKSNQPAKKKKEKPVKKQAPKKIVKKKIPKIAPIVQEQPITQVEEVVEQSVKNPQPIEKKVEVVLVQKTSEEKYIDKNLQKIVKLLSENLYYPRSARKRGIEGIVKVKFVLDTEAKTQDINVISSKSSILSRAAVKTIEELSGKFPKPQEKLTLHVPISYKLH